MNLNKNVNFQETQTQSTHKFFVFRLLLCPHFLLYHIMATNLITFRKKRFWPSSLWKSKYNFRILIGQSSSARISKPVTHRGRSRTAPLTIGRVAMVTCDQSSFFYFRGSAQKRKKDCLIAGCRSYYFVNLNFMLKWLKFACMTRLHFALWVRSLAFWLGKMGFAARLFFLARGFFPRLKKTDSLLCRNFSVMTKKWRLSRS